MATYDGRLVTVQDSGLILSDAQAMPNNTNADSTNIIDLDGSNVFGVPVGLFIDLPSKVIASTKVLDITVLECDTSGGTFTEIKGLKFSWVAADNIQGNYAVGILKNSKRYIKLNYSTTDNLSAIAVSAWIAPLI